MKIKKILAAILALALALGTFSCGEEPNEWKEPVDYYEKFLETAEKNSETDEYTLTEFESAAITSSGIEGLTDAFLLYDSSRNMAYVYNFDTKENAIAFKADLDEQLMGYSLSIKVFGTALVYGNIEVVDVLERGEVFIEEPKPDFCSYRETRDVEGRETVTVKMTVKDYGEVTILLDATTAPVTVANFTKLVSEGFYDGLTFHRVIKKFMVQGGDPEADGTGGSDGKIFGEFSSNGHENDIKHLRGVISMARSGDPNSASSQFFICNADSPHLDGSYAAFGYVISGMSVIDAITKDTAKYGNSSGTISDKSLQAVIEKIEILP